MIRQTLGQAASSLAFVFCIMGTAYAGSFSVSPVRVTLSADKPVVAMTVQNSESEPTVVQLELVQWSQQNGQDVYTPTKDLLATPPIFTLPANGRQIIRIGFRKPLDSSNEAAYRIFLHEIPGPPKPGFQGLRVALKVGVPIFIPAKQAAQNQLSWAAKTSANHQLKISASNVGNTHTQILSIKILLPNGSELVSQQLAHYVLPGQTKEWTFKPEQMPVGPLRLLAKTDAGDMQAEINVDKE